MKRFTFRKISLKIQFWFWLYGILFVSMVLLGFNPYLFESTYKSPITAIYKTVARDRGVDFKCIWSVVDNRTKCKPVCGYGYFGLYGMETCHPWLDCEGLKNIKGHEKINTSVIGYVKEVWISKWEDYEVAVKRLRTDLHGPESKDEFYRGIQFLRDFSDLPEVLQLVGQCKDTLVTELHALNDATNLENHLKIYKDFDNASTRFRLCVDYVHILTMLHSGRGGKVYALCDANDKYILLQQYLLTDDFRLIINDIDSLVGFPVNDGVTEKRLCPVKTRNYSVLFNAPEQRWRPIEEKPFNNSKMSPYDEKIDIWKIPDACKSFLYHMDVKVKVLPHLNLIHQQCKSKDPKNRPNAKEVLKIYEDIYQKLFGIRINA
ncbi:protein O-mannose kinase-like [Saccostrea echinata]|uniref:protein O-mannose kinase-like n=1 Tax=Saccostrea echinata TaxID=191078 RepID=UPI002A8218CE|nr:protein O-mannose kinase-like [Saccostrea echinata]